MAFNLGDIIVTLKANTDSLHKGMTDLHDLTAKAGTGINSMMSSAAAPSAAFLGVVGVATAAVGVFGNAARKAYNEAETAQKQLEHAVLNVSHATQDQLKSTMDLSDALEAKGVLDGDNIKTGLAQLSTFGLSNKAVQGLGGALADLAVNQFGVKASGDQLSQTANTIAKALNGQFGVLEKSGIRFTDLQKKIIETGSEMDKVKAINEGFAQNLKFTNEVALKTAEGFEAHLGVQLGNIQEAIGNVVTNAILPMQKAFSELIDRIGGTEGVMKLLTATAEKMKEWLPVLTGFIIGGIVPALWAAAGATWAFIAPLLPFLAIGAAVGFLVKELMDRFGGWSGLVDRAKVALQALQPVVDFIKAQLQGLWGTIQSQLLPALQRWWDLMSPMLIPTLKVIGAILGGIVVGALALVIAGVQSAIWIFSKMIDKVNDVVEAVKKIVSAFTSLPEKIKGPLETAKNFLDKINPFHKESPSLIEWITKGVGKIEDAYGGMFDSVAAMTADAMPTMQFAAAGIGESPTFSPTNVTKQQTINVSLQAGAFMGTPSEARKYAERIQIELDRIAAQKG